MMKSNNSEQVVQDLILNKPTAEIKSVSYDWETNIAKVGVLFKEENARISHMRYWEQETNGQEVTATQIEDFISNELNDFE